VQTLVGDLNRAYRAEPALWEVDADPAGFAWLELGDAPANVIAFARFSVAAARTLVCVCNFSPVPRPGYRVGLPRPGRWVEVLDTDATAYGGSGIRNVTLEAEEMGWHGQQWSAELHLPPLAVIWLVPEGR
jgi:1,4-alpha-glucan branching enzyme